MLSISSAYSCGSMWDGLRRFIVVVDSYRRLKHRQRCNLRGTVARTSIRWSFNFTMDLYTSLIRCMFGGISWSSILLIHKYCLRDIRCK